MTAKTMTDEELIAALRVEVPFALFNGTQDDWDAAEVKLQSAADRLEALTQPSGKVSGDAQDIANRLRRFFSEPGDGRRLALDAAMMIEHLNGKREAAQLPARPVAKQNPSPVVGVTDSELGTMIDHVGRGDGIDGPEAYAALKELRDRRALDLTNGAEARVAQLEEALSSIWAIVINISLGRYPDIARICRATLHPEKEGE